MLHAMHGPRTLIIGDVHGCADELDDLLRVAGYSVGDRLVFVGDLVAKGPDSAGVVARARELAALAVLGNHEMPILAHFSSKRRGEAAPKIKETHRETALALTPGDVSWLESLPVFLRLEEHGVIVAHAGIVPGIRLEDQQQEALLTMRSIRADGTWSKTFEHGTPWAERYEGPEHVVFGHDAMRNLQLYAFATGLDTGCVYGGELTALELPSRRIYKVRARRAWREF